MAERNRNRLSEDLFGNLGSLLDAIATAESETTEWAADARVHFLRNYTTEFTDPYIKYHLIRDGIRVEIGHGGYDTVAQELLDPQSGLLTQAPDVIVLSLLIEYLDPEVAETSWTADKTIARVDEYVGYVMDRTQSLLVVNTLLPPIDSLISGEAMVGAEAEIERLNAHLRELESAAAGRIFVSEFDEHFRESGGPAALDRRLWVSSQAPFRYTFLNRYARDIAYSVRLLKGRARKCLVLDCDNTIWGGVIGEDGIGGIVLDDQDPPGSHFFEFQQAAVALGEQGVMLALCSKNNEDDVWRVLEEHPHCPLDRSHLVGWRINWQNKAANLASLAGELNIGLESFVFVDDSPQERALIGEMLPEVLVLGVPDDLSAYPAILTKDKLFDTTARSKEDRQRTTMYQDEARRKQDQFRFADLTEYLSSLATVMRVFEVDDASKSRVAQLTQKTNQFNLTTRRYSLADVEEYAAGPDSAVFAMSVCDRYGDMGLTGVLIACRDGDTARVDTLLLSCRVLGRQLEFAFVDQCLRVLNQRWGDPTWKADYLPTRKNMQVEDFWDRVGFSVVASTGDGKQYTLESALSITDYSRIITAELVTD